MPSISLHVQANSYPCEYAELVTCVRCSHMTPPWAPKAVFLNVGVVIDRLTSALSSASWWATSRGLDLENHVVFFVWSYATFMFAWLISQQALPNIPLWSPAWTPITTNVRAQLALMLWSTSAGCFRSEVLLGA